MTHVGTQKIETDRLILRRYVSEDAPAKFRNWTSDPEVTKYLMWKTHPTPEYTQKITDEWITHYSDNKRYHWAITLKENGDEPIGDIAVVRMDEEVSSVHIGYCLGRKWWHKGIMSEALKAVMDFMFDVVGVNRVESRHDPRNLNSGKVMKKCGMKYEGTLRQSDWNNQGICDACYYALLKLER